MIAILKKELRQFFGFTGSYFIALSFLILNALWLWILKTDLNILDSGFADLTHFFSSTGWLFIILIPTLTMNAFSDENQSGTIEILRTRPISSFQLLLGKFFVQFIIVLFILTPTLFYVYSIYNLALPVGNIEFGSLVGSYIGLFFLSSSFISIGIWVSSVSKNQLTAVITSIAISYFLFYGIQELTLLIPDYLPDNLDMLTHFKSIQRGVVDTRDLTYFTSVSGLFLILTYYRISTSTNNKTLVYSLIIIIIINSIGKNTYNRIDLTEDKKYTLSTHSTDLLKTLTESATFRVYLEGNFPPEFKKLQSETKQLLEELKAKNKNIKILFIDPKNNLNKLVKKGLTPSRLTIQDDGIVTETIILPWATLHYGNKTEAISLLKEISQKESQEEQLKNSIQNLEYAFISALKKISTQKEKSIAIINGNGELEDIYMYSLLKTIGSYYHLAKFTLDSIATAPIKTLEQLNTYDLAIIAKPTEKFTEEEKYCLDQYLLNGGKTIWFLDKVHAEMDSLYSSGKMLAYPRDLNLDDFFFRYGARINPDLIKDLYAAKIALATGNTGNKTNFQNFLWYYSPSIKSNSRHPIVENIPPIKFEFTSTIDTLKNNIEKTVLLKSSQLSKKVQTPTLIDLNTVIEKPEPKAFNKGNQFVSVLLEGSFTSAYKDRIKPIELKNSKEIGIPSKMILISDGDIPKNQIHQGNPLELGTDKWTHELYGNKEFLINAIDYLLDDTGLLSLRSKNINLKYLDKKKVIQEKKYWQFLNIILPSLCVIMFGLLFFFFRKRKYAFMAK